MRFVLRSTWIVGLLLGACAASGDEAVPEFGRVVGSLIENRCVGCHGGSSPEAELSLESFGDLATVLEDRKTWDKVLEAVSTGVMPPAEEPQPEPHEVESFVGFLRSAFEHADRTAKPDPGRVTMRRLNRVEYRNTIRDLVGVDFDPAADFPSDDVGHGFDNIGDVLTVSPVLMERYLVAAENIAERAILTEIPPPTERRMASRYIQPSALTVDRLFDRSWRRMENDGDEPMEVGPLNTRYGWEDDGEYVFRVKVRREEDEDRPVQVAILVQGDDLADPTPPEELSRYAGEMPGPAKLLQTFEVTAESRREAQVLEVAVPPMSGRDLMLLAIVRPEGDETGKTLLVNDFELVGPMDMRPASHRQLLAAPSDSSDSSEAERTRLVVSRLLRDAYRRPAEPAEIERLAELVEAEVAAGAKWEAGIQFALQAVLCSPKFLFRAELDDRPDGPETESLDEWQLASRLSYFLWSTMPDAELFDLAERGELSANLDSQVRRMLADSKSEALVRNFAVQWLQIGRLDGVAPDGEMFPDFDDDLRSAMRQETELFFESVMREDRSVLDLVDADYTFLNEELADHYGIVDTAGNREGDDDKAPGGERIDGDGFVRVALRDGTRGGLLTQASVLTVTSNPTRTSPVKRGRWTLEQILGAPPPPPPPDVPELAEEGEAAEGASLRERLEVHRANASCANCHAKMDPIGFALENFDAVGAWRTKDGEFDIDASGEFPDGSKFAGVEDLKQIVRSRSEDFSRCLTEKLLTYALGRGVENYDRPAVERIVANVEAGDRRFSLLVSEIVRSEPFRMRRGLEEAAVEETVRSGAEP